MPAKKVFEARVKYAAKTKRGSKDNRRQSTQSNLAKSVDLLDQNIQQLQAMLEEINRRLSAFEARVDRAGEEEHAWLKLTEHSFEFWDNEADAIYDTL
jgi:predicted RNase H-like nuclease (RuvC/YqgF family)